MHQSPLYLQVGATQIEQSALDNLVNLEELYLAGNKFSSLPEGVLLKTLKTLDLSLNGGERQTPAARTIR
jgi:Leucine-rich repeat (LRR) protein